jgi:cyanosortase A-associated protein
MRYWQGSQFAILAALCGSAFLVLGKSVFYPTDVTAAKSKSALNLPAVASLPGWQLQSSNPSNNPTDSNQNKIEPQNSLLLSGRSYQFSRKQDALDLEIRYLIETDGDVIKMLKGYKSIFIDESSSLMRQRSHIGSYILFTDAKQAHLSACINPSGNSSVTRAQFQSDRNNYDLQFSRIMAWLTGQAELRQKHCLWVHLSSPLNHDSPTTTYQNLESAWFYWYQQNSAHTL